MTLKLLKKCNTYQPWHKKTNYSNVGGSAAAFSCLSTAAHLHYGLYRGTAHPSRMFFILYLPVSFRVNSQVIHAAPSEAQTHKGVRLGETSKDVFLPLSLRYNKLNSYKFQILFTYHRLKNFQGWCTPIQHHQRC